MACTVTNRQCNSAEATPFEKKNCYEVTASPLQLRNVLYETKVSIAYVTLTRPKVLNALNTDLITNQ
jgi:hypothetical protein